MFYALALLALLVKAYAPPGFMVAQNGAVVLCSGMRMAAATPPTAHRDAPHKSDSATDHGCPFAGNVAPILSADPLLRTRTTPPLPRPVAIALRRLCEPGLAAPPPPPRAPPLRLA